MARILPDVAAAHPLKLHKALPARRRPNLVFFRCGGESLHRRLFPLPNQRNWDCMLSCYEPFEESDRVHADAVISGGVSKWDAFAQMRFGQPALNLAGYEHFFLVDDDIEFRDAADIDRMFDLAREHQLAVCQPALSADSSDFWFVTRHHPSSFLRFTNFVECMMPLFSAEAVELLRDDICAAVSGCGLDLIFHHALGPDRRMGVIDAVVVRHMRPTDVVNGAFYRFLRSIGVDHDEEIRWFLWRHGLTGIEAATQGGIGLSQSFP